MQQVKQVSSPQARCTVMEKFSFSGQTACEDMS